MEPKNSKDPASPPTHPRHKSQRITKDPCFLQSCEIPRTISSWILVFFFKYPKQVVLWKILKPPNTALEVDSLPRNVGKKTGSKQHVSAPWPCDLQTELTRWRLQHQKNYIKSVKCSSFLLPSFLPGKARILVAHATPRKTLNLGTYLAFRLHYAVLHARRAAKSLLVEEEFCTKLMQV